jgi:hypothetical protein
MLRFFRKEIKMQFTENYLDEYAFFEKDSVTVEIPFINNTYFEDLAKPFIKVLLKGALKGNLCFLTTEQLVIGFRYEYGQSENIETIKNILLIIMTSVFRTYYDQRDTSDVQDVHLAIAA